MSDPEIKEFFEFLHAGFEMGVEDKVHALTMLGPESYELFATFVKNIAKNPQFFDKATAIAEHLPTIIH